MKNVDGEAHRNAAWWHAAYCGRTAAWRGGNAPDRLKAELQTTAGQKGDAGGSVVSPFFGISRLFRLFSPFGGGRSGKSTKHASSKLQRNPKNQAPMGRWTAFARLSVPLSSKALWRTRGRGLSA